MRALIVMLVVAGCGSSSGSSPEPDGGTSTCVPCTEGATQCDGNAIVTCGDRDGDGCLEWSDAIACPSGQTCSLGTCSDTCVDECADGESACTDPGHFRKCGEADGDPCRDWLAATACEIGAVCSNGSCDTTCTDECQLGMRACSGTGVIECGDANSDGCTEWGPVVPCATGTSCSAGACTPTCSDECSMATCSGIQLRSCGQYDLDPCLDLSAGTSCAATDPCMIGSCSAGACQQAPVVCAAPPAPTCTSSSVLRTYSAAGTCGAGTCQYPYTDQVCAQGCSGGACTGQVGTQAHVISGGESTYFCAIKADASIACWGMINWGTLTPPTGSFSQLDGGYDHICAIRTNGTLDCWGDGGWNEPAGTFTQVSSGYDDSCAIRSDGTLACWPTNGLIAPPGTYTNVAVGDHHACAIQPAGTLVCWGWNGHGQATAPAGTFRTLAAGYDSTCGIKSDNTLQCWGKNTEGQATPPSGTFTAISAGWWHYCGIRSDASLACWGKNTSAQTIPPSGSFIAVGVNPNTSCAIRADRTLTCWGKPSTPPSGMFGQP
jgi:hypothetical protein